MKIEIIKEYHREHSGVKEKYSIKTTHFKIFKFFKMDKSKINETFYGNMDISVYIILYHVFILTPALVFSIALDFHVVPIILSIIEYVIIKALNYHSRELYDDLEDGENEIKNLIKLKTLNKKIVQKYTIENNELIIEKFKENNKK